MRGKIHPKDVDKELGELAGRAPADNPLLNDQLGPLLMFDNSERVHDAKRCAQISAILRVAAAEQGPLLDMPMLVELNEHLRNAGAAEVAGVLDELKAQPEGAGLVLEACMTRGRAQAAFPGVVLPSDRGEVLEVSETTLQNLRCAHLVNQAVKRLLVNGAPNQAPDVLRTEGRNLLMYEQKHTLLHNDTLWHGAGETEEMRAVQEQHAALHQWARILDRSRGALASGEEVGIVLSASAKSTCLGTGKCGEHAATSMALLLDEASMKALGAELPEGTMVILALADQIDHTYVLLAAPGAVEIELEDTGARRLNVRNGRDVVVVDPWMPVPCAHTLDRSSPDISPRPVCKLLVVKHEGKLCLLEREGGLLEYQQPPVQMLGHLQNAQAAFHMRTMELALVTKILPWNARESLATACGKAAEKILFTDDDLKPPLYQYSHMSTPTPMDAYQRAGADDLPERFVMSDGPHFEEAMRAIEKSQQKDVLEIAATEQALMVNVPARAICTEYSGRLMERRMLQAANQQQKVAEGRQTAVLRTVPHAGGSPHALRYSGAVPVTVDGLWTMKKKAPAATQTASSSSSHIGN